MPLDDEAMGGWTLDPEVRDALRLERAHAAFQRGDLLTAVVEAEELLSDSPEHVDALALLADVTLDLGDSTGAMAIYEHLLEHVSATPELLTALSIARFESCEISGAISAAREAVRLDPSSSDAHYVLGMCLERSAGRSSEAIASLLAAHQLDAERFPMPAVIADDEWESLYVSALTQLPPALVSFWSGVPVRVETLPPLALLRENQPPLPPTVRGLFVGTPPDEPDASARPEALRLFSANLVRLGTRDAIIEALIEVLEGEAMDWLGVDDMPIEDDSAPE